MGSIKTTHLNRREFLNLLGAGSGLFTGVKILPAVSRSPLDLATANKSQDEHSSALPLRQVGTLGNAGAADFYKPPKLSLMVGFIKDPQEKHYTLEEWARDLGGSFDAGELVDRISKAGFVEIIWYDKWINGLVFHKTRTTTFMTTRDFLADLAPACRKANLKLIIYFNVFYDGNPEFAQWLCKDERGHPLTFPPPWPANLMSIYSPFREKALEQVHELFEIYKVDGLWLDVPNYPTISFDSWTQNAFQKLYGKPMDQARPSDRKMFAIDSVVNWTQKVASYARKLNPAAVVTYNGAYEPLGTYNGVDGSQGVSPRLAIGMADTVDYFATELHTRTVQAERVPVLSKFEKPVEANYLVSDSWFTPLDGGAVKTMKSEDEINEVMARVVGGGLNLSLDVTLAHDGAVDEGTLEILELAGSWLNSRRGALQDFTNLNDVGIVLGTADRNDLNWPGGKDNYEKVLTNLEKSLRQAGHLPGRMINCEGQQHWDTIPASTRMLIVPDRVNLSNLDRERIKGFVEKGGTILAFGRGAGLGRSGDIPQVDDMFGVHTAGYLESISGTHVWFEWEGKIASLIAPILFCTPQTAQVLFWARAAVEGELPLLTKNPAGRGWAYFCPATEAAMLNSEDALGAIWEQVIGEPMWKLSSPARYSVNMRTQKHRIAVNILDDISLRGGIMQRYHPAYVTLSLNAKSVHFDRATVIPENRSLAISNQDFWKGVEIFPNPEVTLLLE